MNNPKFLRRKEAAEYLRSRYGFCSANALAKLATVGGGPPYHKAGPMIVLYAPADLDAWAMELIGDRKRSTSEAV